MRLSDLKKTPNAEVAFGVLHDEPDFFPPETLKFVSFQAVAEGDELDQDLLDTIIAYKDAGIEIALELPSGFAVPVAEVMKKAFSLDFSLVLLPGASSDSGDYLDTIRTYARALNAFPAFSKAIHPVTDCISAAIYQAVGRDGLFFPASFWNSRISEQITPELFDRLIEAIGKGIDDAAGEGAFQDFLLAHVANVHGDAEVRMTSIIQGVSSPS